MHVSGDMKHDSPKELFSPSWSCDFKADASIDADSNASFSAFAVSHFQSWLYLVTEEVTKALSHSSP